MGKIEILSDATIDQIAAGEVVERPASIVKELMENAIDAGATEITCEIENGGITLIRISDNGCGIEKDQLRKAFLRHSTSKLRTPSDLLTISSLGFRGEALSSIASIAIAEVLTKTKDSETGWRLQIEGGKETAFEEVGIPDGTTFNIRQIFFNTPARRKFLKTPMTEMSHIVDLCEKIAMSYPEIAITCISDKKTRLRTSGNGKLKDVIYGIYGRDVALSLLPVDVEKDGMCLKGFIGKPVLSRGNRNFETLFVNGRCVKDSVMQKALEDGYKDYSMQHKFPFAVLNFTLPGDRVDVNVHPGKREIRFQNPREIYGFFYAAIKDTLSEKERVLKADLPEPKVKKTFERKAPTAPTKKEVVQEELKALETLSQTDAPKDADKKDSPLDYYMAEMRNRVTNYHNRLSAAEVKDTHEINAHRPHDRESLIREAVSFRAQKEQSAPVREAIEPETKAPSVPPKTDFSDLLKQEEEKLEQLSLFEETSLKDEAEENFRIIGQIFETYWVYEKDDSVFFVDQHAAHERCNYEKMLKDIQAGRCASQLLSPPILLTLQASEENLLKEYRDRFKNLGYEIEPFGGNTWAVRAVPAMLPGIAKKELLISMIDNMSEETGCGLTPEEIDGKIASMSCKAAVKGGSRMSEKEARQLIQDLLKLENPYHCPHGRPTIIEITKKEFEKKFKRIV